MTSRSVECTQRSRDKLLRMVRCNNAAGRLAAALTLVAALPGAPASAQLFPDGPRLVLPAAHPRPTTLYGRVLSVSRGESRYVSEREADAGIGATIPVVSLNRGRMPMALGLGVGVAARFSLDDPRSAMISSDWVVGIQVAARRDQWGFAVNLYHESSHLGDEYIDRFDADRLDWTREVASLWASRTMGPVTAHGQVSYTLIDELSLDRPAAGVGLDFRGGAGRVLGSRVRPVAAVYLEGAGYANWKVTTSGRLGVALESGSRSVAISLVALNGLSTQRQFYAERSRYVGVELRFD